MKPLKLVLTDHWFVLLDLFCVYLVLFYIRLNLLGNFAESKQ